MDDLTAGLPAAATPEHWINLALKLACPVCRAPGLVRVCELDRALMCKACDSWFRVNPTRLVQIPAPPRVIQVEVRTETSEYTTHEVLLDDIVRKSLVRVILLRLARLRPQHVPWQALGIILIAAVSLCVVALNYPFSSAEEIETPLPSNLDARERLLVESWFKSDVHQMLRLVSASRDRDLRQWLSKHPPPDRVKSTMPDRTMAIDIASITKSMPNIADVVARVDFLAEAASSAELIIKHRWSSDKNGTWYFVPYVPPSPPRYKYK